MRHYEIAAKGRHPAARHDLGLFDHDAGRRDRALKHFMISAKMGYEVSCIAIKFMFTHGDATKDDYAEALAGFRDATDEMRSPQREEAKAFFQNI